MATTREEIKTWFERGVSDQKTHMIVVCDTFDWEDYPVYVSENEDVRVIEKKYDNKNMQDVMEVYNLNKDMEEQLSAQRNWNY